LPPSAEGEWWELSDDSRGGLPYYYQTKTGETVWERPAGFIIPLGIIQASPPVFLISYLIICQNTALGRRLSTGLSKSFAQEPNFTDTLEKPTFRRSRSSVGEHGIIHSPNHIRQTRSSRSASGRGGKKPAQRTYSSERWNEVPHSRPHVPGQQLTPIPGSDVSDSRSPSIHESVTPIFVNGIPHSSLKGKKSPNGTFNVESIHSPDSVSRAQAKSSSYVAHRPRPAQSLNAALEMLTTSNSDSGHDSIQKSPTSPTSDLSVASGSNSTHGHERLTVTIQPSAPTNGKGKGNVPPSPQRPIPAVPDGRNPGARRGILVPTVAGKGISRPIPNHGEYPHVFDRTHATTAMAQQLPR
jgi:Rho GTPase-activating protein 39